MRPVNSPRFTFIRTLGAGGTAEVALATAEGYAREIALKYPLGEAADPLFANLAVREYELIGDLRFPGLVHLLERPHTGPDYILLEYCSGPTLNDVAWPVPLPRTLSILSSIAVALEFLRAHRLIHGDLKQHNFFLPNSWPQLREDSLFYVKLSDFSLGLRESELPQIRAGLGTVGFMAPETIQRRECTHRSDLFAFGVIAYYLLAGKHPFMEDDSDPVRVNARVTEEQPTPLRQLRPEITLELENLIALCLSKDPAARPESAFEICRLLEQAGSVFPYQRAIAPRHLMNQSGTFDEYISSHLHLSPRQDSWLRSISENDLITLRLVLSANFASGNLTYAGGTFEPVRDMIWPSWLRRKKITAFSKSGFAAQRRAVKGSIDVSNDKIDNSLSLLLPHLLRPTTVVRIADRAAIAADKSGDKARAARRYVQAGRFADAERCAWEAAHTLSAADRGAEALTLCRQVIRYAETTGRMFDARNLIMFSGDLHKLRGELAEAEEQYRQIIALYQNGGPDKLLAETYKDLGDVLRLKNETAQGREALHQALKIFEQLGDALEVSKTYNNLGNTHVIAGEFIPAQRHYRKALHIQRAANDQAAVGSTLSNIGTAYFLQGRTTRGLRVLELSLLVKRNVGDAGEMARTLNNLGYAANVNGDAQKAETYLQESLEINRRIGSKKEILHNLENLADVSIQAGHLSQALALLTEGLPLARELEDTAHTGLFLLQQGRIFSRLGRFGDATNMIVEAETLLSDLSSHELQTSLVLAKARRALGLNNQAVALALAKEALHRAQVAGDQPNELQALMVMARLNADAALLERARELIKEQQLQRETLLLAVSALYAEHLEHKRTIAVEELTPLSAALVTQPEHLDLAWMHLVLAELLLVAGKPEAAETHISRGRHLAESMQLRPERIMALVLHGRVSSTRRAYEQCYAVYKQALSLVKETAATIPSGEEQQNYLASPEVQFLIGEIKKLSATFAKK